MITSSDGDCHELGFIKNILKENLQRDKEKEKISENREFFQEKFFFQRKVSFPRENSLFTHFYLNILGKE